MKINIKDSAAVQAALDEVQKKCSTRCESPSSIKQWADEAEKRLTDARIPQKLRSGIGLKFGYCARPAKAYKYPYIGTVGVLMRGKDDWFLVEVERAYCDEPNGNRLVLPGGNQEEIEKRFMLNFCQM